MGILDSLEGMTQQATNSGEEQTKVAGGFVQALGEHPGGIGGLLESLRGNGMGDHVNQWTNGQSQPTTPEQVQTGLSGTGLIERTAERAGVSPEVAKIALASILPIAMAHFAPGGQPVQGGNLSGMASQLLSRFL